MSGTSLPEIDTLGNILCSYKDTKYSIITAFWIVRNPGPKTMYTDGCEKHLIPMIIRISNFLAYLF